MDPSSLAPDVDTFLNNTWKTIHDAANDIWENDTSIKEKIKTTKNACKSIQDDAVDTIKNYLGLN